MLNNAAKEVIVLVKRLYGETCCSYNIHHILHLDEIRTHGPLPKSSAFNTEAYYANVRKSVLHHPSKNIGKQILQDSYFRYTQSHSCKKSMIFAVKETPTTSDRYCYVFAENEYIFYKIVEVGEADLKAWRILTACLESPDQSLRHFTSAGFARYLMALNSRDETLKKEDVSGKAIRIGPYIASCSTLTLFEAN